MTKDLPSRYYNILKNRYGLVTMILVRNDKENQQNRLGNPKVGSHLCKILVNDKYGSLINEAYIILVFSNLKENKNGFLS